ncbi:uncharacterized protein C8Q71DRAFT_854405 [Rhodofomes roseus]|uniref:Alpha/beta hydrolase family protein n=1 Tax=Rhodofomes roseus TaxID=34475 RepID=A0ABQ8KTD8_9APHY|nr:uncharacterized protein C8Q71DRAFT_854405 [Rhodofomes roseus]KAH9842049.1 hypothetical protein C8Q71DRAFT_854405 [Rhodofomes roseus]
MVIFIHGGGLVAGFRNEASSARFTDFVRDFALSRGFLFISPDHRLVWPSAGLDIIEDMKTLFAFPADSSFSETYLPSGVSLDTPRIAALGVIAEA